MTFLEHGTHFLASAFPNLATRSEVAYLLCVLLLPFLSWQGLPWTAQQGHLPPTAICAQVLLILHSLCQPFSLSVSLLPQSSLSSSHTDYFKHIHACACIMHVPDVPIIVRSLWRQLKSFTSLINDRCTTPQRENWVNMVQLSRSVMFYWIENMMCTKLTVILTQWVTHIVKRKLKMFGYL